MRVCSTFPTLQCMCTIPWCTCTPPEHSACKCMYSHLQCIGTHYAVQMYSPCKHQYLQCMGTHTMQCTHTHPANTSICSAQVPTTCSAVHAYSPCKHQSRHRSRWSDRCSYRGCTRPGNGLSGRGRSLVHSSVQHKDILMLMSIFKLGISYILYSHYIHQCKCLCVRVCVCACVRARVHACVCMVDIKFVPEAKTFQYDLTWCFCSSLSSP